MNISRRGGYDGRKEQTMELIRRMQLNLIDWACDILMSGVTHLENRRRIVWHLWDAARKLADDRRTVS